MASIEKANKAYWKKYKHITAFNNSVEEKISDLSRAIRNNRLDIVKLLVEQGECDVNAVSENEAKCQGLTPIHVAVRHNQLDCMKYLISCGADFESSDRFGFRPIHDAALYGFTECLEELLSHNASVGGSTMRGQEHVTPLYYAIQQNHKECIKTLQNHSSVSEALFWEMASKRDNISIVDLLENNKKDLPSSKTCEKWLNNAALNGNLRYLQRFKEHLARNFTPKETLKSIITSTIHDKEEYLKTLLVDGLDANITDKDQNTAMHFAARYGHGKCMELLVQHGANLNAKNKDNWTPLHVAIRQGGLDGVHQLLELGANINVAGGSDDDIPVGIALKLPSEEEIMTRLLDATPDLTIKNKKGELVTNIKSDFDTLNEHVLQYVRN